MASGGKKNAAMDCKSGVRIYLKRRSQKKDSTSDVQVPLYSQVFLLPCLLFQGHGRDAFRCRALPAEIDAIGQLIIARQQDNLEKITRLRQRKALAEFFRFSISTP